MKVCDEFDEEDENFEPNIAVRHPQLFKQNSLRWKYLFLKDLRIERKIEGVSPVEPRALHGWRIADGEIPNIGIDSPRQLNADC